VHSLADYGERPAVVALPKDKSQTWSFAALADHAQRLATGLVEAGLQRGTHVMLFAPNRPEWILACCALLAATAVPVPIDAPSSAADLQHVLGDSDARWMFTTATLAKGVEVVGDALEHEVLFRTRLTLDMPLRRQRKGCAS
jgi:acyl-CoA synthetase (AMP-forming)/AMP-acid ligase II